MNESAASLRWLLDELGEPLARAWVETRDRMRAPTGQTIVATTDWIADPWIVKGVEPAGLIAAAAPRYEPPDDVDAWPHFGVAATLSALALPATPTRHGGLSEILAATPAGGDDGETAMREFLASQERIAAHGDEAMILGDQVRAWILAAIGSLLRGLVFAPPGTDEALVAQQAVARVDAPLRLALPRHWVLSDRFGDRRLELLLNLTVEADGSFTPIDPADLRVGQGLPWQQAWRWLSMDVAPGLVLEGVRLAARLLRNPGLRRGLGEALAAGEPPSRLLATGVLRRWVLALRAMAWAEHALVQAWEVVRPPDIACVAFSALKPEWPRRLLAISHRSFEAKPALRRMSVWRSARCAIDASYVPSWETNTGMIWGLFAATPALLRVRTEAYQASVWCRREGEMIDHFCRRADFVAGRHVLDARVDQLAALDAWEAVARGAPRATGPGLRSEFPPSELTVWSPRPAPASDLSVMRAAGALRVMSAVLGRARIVGRVVDALRGDGDFPVIPAPTNHPGGWPAYAAIFRAVDALAGGTPGAPAALRLPDEYGDDDVARDRALCQLMPDMRLGTPALGDALVAIEFLRSVWPVMVDQGLGRFLVLNLQGLSRDDWLHDPAWSLQRGLAALRGLPVPLWFLQNGDQGLSDWNLPGDPPILTEHVDAQFSWMLEASPEAAVWRRRYPEHAGLSVSPELQALYDA